MKRIPISIFLILLFAASTSFAQDQPKVKVKKEMARVLKDLPADVQMQILEYAQRKSEAYSLAQAATEAPKPQQTQTASQPDRPVPAPGVATAPAPKPVPAPAAQPAAQPAQQPATVQVNPAPATQHNNAQPARPAWMTEAEGMKATTVQWSSTDHDFGKVAEGPTVNHTFTFKNTGSVPLKLTYVKASCGCTTPKWSEGEIPPGGEGFVEVAFSTKGRPGMQNKSVTVAGNFEGNTIQVLRFKCEVLPAAAPAGE